MNARLVAEIARLYLREFGKSARIRYFGSRDDKMHIAYLVC